MKDIVRNCLIPTADMVISMSKEFGVPLTQEDFEGNIQYGITIQHPPPPPHSHRRHGDIHE